MLLPRRPSLSPLQTAQMARAHDKFTIETLGVPGVALLERAGSLVADTVFDLDVVVPGTRVAVVCGPGNNGGDGWVAARHLRHRGVEADVFALRPPTVLKGDARVAALAYEESCRQLLWGRGDRPAWQLLDEGALQKLGSYPVLVDALFGTGLDRPLDVGASLIVDVINRARSTVVAVDVPSGLPTDGQRPAGAVVRADVTVTFSGRKIAHVCEAGAPLCGAVVDAMVAISTPPGEEQLHFVLDGAPSPTTTAPSGPVHKGVFGHVGVVPGVDATLGASLLAARGALRAGAGKVSLLTSSRPAQTPPEVMIAASPSAFTSAVVGPGWGTAADAGWSAIDDSEVPLVVDADALPGFRARASSWGASCVLTPHPKEAALLLGASTDEVQAHRADAAQQLQQAFDGHVVVLKGETPIVAHNGELVWVPGHNPALAVGGSGDVLAGVIAARLAAGHSAIDAALDGVWLHQDAGARLSRGRLASDIADAVDVGL